MSVMSVADPLIEVPTLPSSAFRAENQMGMTYVATSFACLVVGAVFGVVQALVRANAIPIPINPSYYQLLTGHGILMALAFTTFFILGYLINGTARALNAPLPPLGRALGWLGYWTMLGSATVIVVEVLANRATVLYTFYAPLRASAAFYIAATLFIIGSWIGGGAIFVSYLNWRARHPGKLSPLFAFMAVATNIMWLAATLGVAVESLVQLIPWSLGWVPTINVELSRTLFWYFGHPLVYFWLLPAYIAWYVNIPKIIGGQVFSDTLARLSILLLVVFSLPVGIHHELMDTGISAAVKFFEVVLTFAVVIPSLMTAFSVTASLEQAGRARGGRGLLGWIFKLPWGDPRFLAPAMGMIAFVFGGAGGTVNASYQMDAVVHNTLWIVGHFHVTLATTVVLTFFGISYWFVPAMTGRPLWGKRLAVLQTFIWVIGMVFMSTAMHLVGLLGDPRRTASTTYAGSAVSAAWQPYMTFIGIGGSLLGVGVIIFLVVIIGTVLSKKRQETEFPFAVARSGGMATPAILEKWSLWIDIAIALVVIAYTFPIAQLVLHAPPGSLGFQTW